MGPCAGRGPSASRTKCRRPFDVADDEHGTPRRRSATWMMSSTTPASRASRWCDSRGRSRWSRGGASRPSSAPAVAAAEEVQRGIEPMQPVSSTAPRAAQTHNLHRCRRSVRRGFRARAVFRALDTAGSSAGPAALTLSGCVGREVRQELVRHQILRRRSVAAVIAVRSTAGTRCRASLDERKTRQLSILDGPRSSDHIAPVHA